MKSRWKVVCLAGLMCFSVLARAEVTVTQAWVRGTVPGQTATGAFLKITSSVDAKLVAAASPAARLVEVHEMSMKENVMSMRAVGAVPMAAGKTLEFKPGGYHVMLMDLVKPLGKDDKVPLTLTVLDKDGKRWAVSVMAEVRALGADGMKH